MKKLYTLKHINTLILIISLGIISPNLLAQKEECHADFEFEIQNLTVTFTNTSNFIPIEIFWDFGDGNYSSELNPVHTYADSGVYLVYLQTTNDSCFDEKARMVEIGQINNDDCLAFFEYETTGNNLEINFNNLSLGNIDSVLWDFGDGSTSKLTNPIHIFPDEGSYFTCLMIYTELCMDVYCEYISVDVSNDCEAKFNFNIDSQRPNIVHFTNESAGNNIMSEWDFDDIDNGGSFSTEEKPTHIFPENRTYQVKLKISANNCSDEIIKTIQIDVPLTIDFTFRLDSNNAIANTFEFESDIEGVYDDTYWDFDYQSVANKETVSHIYPEQNKEYEACLTAEYHFNDTSSLKKTTCKSLTTSEYFNMGGQVFFGDSLLNNPITTGDTAIAYLYRIDGDNTHLIDTNYYHYLGYYWFAQQLKAKYIVKTQLLENSTHFYDYAPTYAGNTTSWEDAEVIDLMQDIYRKDIHLAEQNTTKNESGTILGAVSDLFNNREETTQAVVYLYKLEDILVDFQYPDDNDNFNFTNLSPGHYVIKGDITGIHSHHKMAYIADDYKSTNLKKPAQLFPNPATDYSILHYENSSDRHQLNINIHTIEGRLIDKKHFDLSSGTNYLHINLHNYPKGLLLLQLSDPLNEKPIKLLHY